MRAVVAHGARDLRVDDMPTSEPGRDEVLVAVAVGGICGSDLHYYHRGGVGDYAIRAPMVLGHELAGRVLAVGDSELPTLAPGTPVAINPSRPCGVCACCVRGDSNVCMRPRFLGSASSYPHVHGGFCESLVIDAHQCMPVPEHLDLGRAALAEPLAVAIHAASRAQSVRGRTALITGAGPIGALIAHVIQADGAERVIISDVSPERLAVGISLGATDAVLAAELPQSEPFADVAFEASGSVGGLATCVAAVGPRGRVVLVGLHAEQSAAVPVGRLVTGEIDVVGSFRFTADEFEASVKLIASGAPVERLVTARYDIVDAGEAFDLASDRCRSMKVQLALSSDTCASKRLSETFADGRHLQPSQLVGMGALR